MYAAGPHVRRAPALTTGARVGSFPGESFWVVMIAPCAFVDHRSLLGNNKRSEIKERVCYIHVFTCMTLIRPMLWNWKYSNVNCIDIDKCVDFDIAKISINVLYRLHVDG